jgi:hypothetical protein
VPSLYSQAELDVTETRIVAGGASFATSSVQGVWVAEQRPLVMLYVLVGLLGLMYAGAMMSCGGIVLSALANDDNWTTKATLIAAGSVALLVLAKRLPPVRYAVAAAIGGQNVTLLQTADLAEAQKASAAVSKARGI